MNDPDITPPGDRIGELEDRLVEAERPVDNYRDALTSMQRERDAARAAAAEILAAYESATRFDRTPTDEDRLAEWRKYVRLETS